MLKRTLTILLVLVMALTAVGCTGGGNQGGNSGTVGGPIQGTVDFEDVTLDSDALLASMPAELKGTKIVFLNWYNPDEREEKDVIAAFEQKSGVDVEYRILDHNTYATLVAQMIQTDEQADVMRLKNPNISYYKLLQPLSVTGFDYSGKEWDQYTMGLYTVGQNTYATNLKYTPFFLPGMMFYNYQTFEDMGFEDPYELWKEGKWTWSKLKEYCNTWVTENGTDYLGASCWSYPSTVANAPFFKKSADGITYELDLNNQTALNCWQFVSEARSIGLFGTYLHEGFDQMKQKMLIDHADASAVQNSSAYFKKTKMTGKLKAVPAPVWDGEGATGEYYVPMHEVVAYGIPKTAKNAKAVPYFLGYMCNFANYNQAAGEGGFFVNEQIKEVYMELMAIEKRNYDFNSDIANYSSNQEIGNFSWMLFNRVDSTQINSWLQEREYILKDSLKLYNEELLKYSK